MNKIKEALIKSVLPHTKEQLDENGEQTFEVNVNLMIDALYQATYHLTKEAFEEGVYSGSVEWERDFIKWLESNKYEL